MGEEIKHSHFSLEDFEQFQHRLEAETTELKTHFSGHLSETGGYTAGFELEACLVDQAHLRPNPVNTAFLDALQSPLASAELAAFDVEFNTLARPLTGKVFQQFHHELSQILAKARQAAHSLDSEILYCGILPTLEESDLTARQMSPLKRYKALNEQVLASRQGSPIKLDIKGREHLATQHQDVMLEAAATSFQVHYQTPAHKIADAYNASLVVSAPLLAAATNAPFLFGKDLWNETRIPVFEQSVDSGGYAGAAKGPLHRVTFGSGYIRGDIMECFEENLAHYPPLLPILFDEYQPPFAHLRLHNGTLWRWNRPILGFDKNGKPHIRLEHRSLPGGPTVSDMIANAAFFYGLIRYFQEQDCSQLEFAAARDNFYEAARFGLSAKLQWLDGKRYRVKDLLLEQLLPDAHSGLVVLNIDRTDIDHYLGIMEARVKAGASGAAWQRLRYQQHHGNLEALTRDYLQAQHTDQPVHLWTP